MGLRPRVTGGERRCGKQRKAWWKGLKPGPRGGRKTEAALVKKVMGGPEGKG